MTFCPGYRSGFSYSNSTIPAPLHHTVYCLIFPEHCGSEPEALHLVDQQYFDELSVDNFVHNHYWHTALYYVLRGFVDIALRLNLRVLV